MSYLEIIEKVKKDRQKGSQPPSEPESYYETNEFNEKSFKVTAKLNKTPESPVLEFLGAERGYLTLENLPELQRRLELSGWNTDRRGDQLVCWSKTGRKPRIQ